jgi:hypothetical protein
VAHPPKHRSAKREGERDKVPVEWAQRTREGPRNSLSLSTCALQCFRLCATWRSILFWWRTLFQVSMYATLYTHFEIFKNGTRKTKLKKKLKQK